MELVVNHIDKSFKNLHAVKNINLVLHSGIHGLLGANGSGKTTLLRILCGLLPQDQGNICFNDIDMNKQYDLYVSHLGYLPQNFGYYPYYTVFEFLEYMCILKNLSKEYSKERIEYVLQILHLEKQKKKKMSQLSGGMLRRVGIAQALLNEPKILILDEPTAGLDPKERIALRNIISSISKDCIILISTHIVSDIETIADDVIVMKEGSVLLHDCVDNLLKLIEGKVWEITLSQIEAIDFMKNILVVQQHNINDKVYLRFIADNRIHESAENVIANLDDLYLYYFNDIDTNEK